MIKNFIKEKLRESLFSKLAEVKRKSGNKEKSEHSEIEDSNTEYSELDGDEKKKLATITNKIKNATQGDNKLLKLSQVMDKAGVGDSDSATDRSEFGKKVSGKPDADGKIRHLSPTEADKMGKVVDNPNAFN